MGGKSGGGGRTPYLAPNTLNSKQKIKVVHLLGAGQFNGWQNGNDDPFRSIFFNDTPVKNKDGSHNFNGVKLNWLSGEMNQQYLVGFDATEKTISVGARVRKDYPVIRTITSPEVNSLRVTVGVDSLMEQKDNGDVVGTKASLQVQLIKDGKVMTSRLWERNEKGSASFQDDLVFTALPDVPFDIKCVRTMPDSNTDKLRNNTFFFSYVESVDAKFSYPGCAMVGLEFDAEQFGSNLPTITYAVQGKIIQVPSNYDAATRTYTGLWDGLLKPAYSNNPAWIMYDVCTDEMDGFGLQMKGFQIDKAKLYEIGRYCDEMIDDGEGGKEPRFVFNGVLQGNDAYTVLNNIASVFRGMPVWLGDRLSFVYDKSGLGPVAMYTNANVVDGLFSYSHVPLSAIINSVQYEYADERDGCRLRVEELSNDKSIAKYRKLNTEKITVYGATKRSYAVRHAKWHLETAETENQSVTFSIGREGIKHAPYEIIAIADNDFAGDSIGGRILSVASDVVQFDRALNAPRKVAIFCQDGKSHEFNVVKKLANDRYQLDGMPNAIEYAVFSAWLGNVQPRLFKAISIEENTDSGTYSISAVKYNPNKGGVVDAAANGVNDTGTTYNPVPVINNPHASNDGDSIILGWGSLAVTGEDISYEIKLYKDGELYKTYQQKEPELRLKDLPQGEYVAKIRARASGGIFSDEITIAFSTTYTIKALRTTGINWGIQINWEVPPLLTSNAHTEIWYSKTNDILKGVLLAKVPYPQTEFVLNNLSVGDEYYFWVRLVDAKDNRGEFTASVLGKPNDNPKDMLDMLEGQITDSQLSKDLLGQLEAGGQAGKNSQDALDKVNQEIQDRIAAIQKEADVRSAQIEAETNARLTDIKKLNDGLTQEVTERKSADGNLQQQVTTLKSSTDANTAAIQTESKARTTADGALGKRIDTVVAESNSNKAAITAESKARASADNALGVRIDAVQATANGNKASITSEAEARASADGALGKRIDSVSVKTDSNTANISKVEKAQVSDKKALTEQIETTRSELNASLENIGTRNYANDSDFLKGYWYFTKGGNANAVGVLIDGWLRNENFDGIDFAQWQLSDSRGGTGLNQLEPNTSYTLSFEARALKGSRGRIGTLFRVALPDGNLDRGSKRFELTEDAKKYAISFVTGEMSGSTLRRIMFTNNSIVGGWELRKIKLEKGAYATDWSPAPEDIESNLNELSASITQQSQTMADLNGKLSATYSLKVETQKDGKKVVAGMAVGVDGATGESQFIVKSDKFSVHDGTTSKPVFMVANGKTGINGDLIVNGTILGKHIKANEKIQAPVLEGGVINAGTINGGLIKGARIEAVDLEAANIIGDVIAARSFREVNGELICKIEASRKTKRTLVLPQIVLAVDEGKTVLIEVWLNNVKIAQRTVSSPTRVVKFQKKYIYSTWTQSQTVWISIPGGGSTTATIPSANIVGDIPINIDIPYTIPAVSSISAMELIDSKASTLKIICKVGGIKNLTPLGDPTGLVCFVI